MSGTTIPNLPLEASVSRSAWGVSQEGSGPGATYRVTWSGVFEAINNADVVASLGYTPVNKAGDSMSGGLTLTSGALSVAGGTVTVGNSSATVATVTLNSSAGSNGFVLAAAGTTQWAVTGDASAFKLTRYSSGVPIDVPFSVNTSTGATTFANALLINVGTAGTGGGSAPLISIFSPTASKGHTVIETNDNTGNTATTINVVSQAGARTYNIPDAGGSATFSMITSSVATNGLPGTQLALTAARNADGTVVTATPGSGLFSIASTVGTNLDLIGQNSKSATITSDAIWEWATPATYIAGKDLTVTVNAAIAGTGTSTGSTIGVSAYAITNSGTVSANIGPATQTLTGSATDYSFIVTGTSLTAIEKMLFDLQTKVIETGGANNINSRINSVRVG